MDFLGKLSGVDSSMHDVRACASLGLWTFLWKLSGAESLPCDVTGLTTLRAYGFPGKLSDDEGLPCDVTLLPCLPSLVYMKFYRKTLFYYISKCVVLGQNAVLAQYHKFY